MSRADAEFGEESSARTAHGSEKEQSWVTMTGMDGRKAEEVPWEWRMLEKARIWVLGDDESRFTYRTEQTSGGKLHTIGEEYPDIRERILLD